MVPAPKAPFDDLVAATVTFMKDNPYLWQVGFGSLLLGVVLSVIIKFTSKKRKSDVSKKSDASKKSGAKKSAKRE